LNKFKHISDVEMVKRHESKRSKQAVIAGRLLRIRAEMQALDSQLKQNTQQSADGNDLESLEALKGQLDGIYQTQAFQNLLLKRRDIAGAFQRRDGLADEQIKASGKDRLNLDALVSSLKKQEKKEEEKGEQVIELVYDRSKKDMATLMRLNSLKKRVHFIKHVLGDWKPTPRYKTLTDQIVQVSKLLELLDANKIKHYQNRVDMLLGEIADMQTRLTAEQRKEDYGHPKELIEKLNTACLSVKMTLESIPKLVERLEQKRKLHEMCA